MLRLRLPGVEGGEISHQTDAMDVFPDSGNNNEFWRLEGTDDSVSVSTTKNRYWVSH